MIMKKLERRNCHRYQLNYPIIVSSSRGIENPEGWHYGEILDAGKYGIRLRLDNFGAVSLGADLQLVCQPATGKAPNNKCMPVAIRGKVVWLDTQANQFALLYTH